MSAASPEPPHEPTVDAPSMVVDTAVLQRRVPLQQRGHQTLDQILQAAAHVAAFREMPTLRERVAQQILCT